MTTKIKTKYSEEEYKIMVEKVSQGTATEGEKKAVRELFIEGMSEVESILNKNN